MTYSERAQAFAALHQPGNPVVLYNIWDAGTAKAVVKAGAAAVATGSWSVARAHGYDDGEQIPLDLLLTISRRIADTCGVPMTVDFEGGFAKAPEQLAENAAKLVETGAIGMNFEDQVVGTPALYGIGAQAERIAAVRSANADLFINARTDLFLKEQDRSRHEGLVSEALERAAAYGEAGASGFFVPGLTDPALVARVCEGCSLPVNTMMKGISLEDARAAGVARASWGPLPYAEAMQALGARFQELA